jgi:hypothetical protein
MAVAMPSVVASRASGSTQLITFDEFFVGEGVGITIPGNNYADQGVLIASGKVAPDFFTVGDDLSFSDLHNQFGVHRNFSTISPRNTFFPSPDYDFNNDFTHYFDILLTFTTPVTYVAVHSDRYPNDPPNNSFDPNGDPIRLAALAPTPLANQFSVLAFDQKRDDAIGPPDDLLAIDLGGRPFSYALIEVIDEREEFDNLRFIQVPEPSTAVLLVIGCVAILIIRRR